MATSTKLTSSCLEKAADNEPIFVLRAQDMLSDELVDTWAEQAALFLGENHPKVLKAKETAQAMRKWATRKYPD